MALPAAAGGQCSLLCCLSQLKDDVFSSYLLPKLIEQGSAGAVAFTCSQLRRLCQSSTQHLDLSAEPLQDSPCNNPALAKQLVAAFPQCSSLKVAWHSSSLDGVHEHISTLLRGLAGLHTMSITYDTSDEDADLGPVLTQLHEHATGVYCLRLQLDRPWEGNSAWKALGGMVNLTRLDLAFGTRVEFPCALLDLQSLSGLIKLQSFTTKAPVAYWADPFDNAAPQPAAQQFPACLTTLTQLVLPLEVVWNISSICECTSLCDLQLRCADDPSPRRKDWPAHDWGALTKLSRLTHLHIGINRAGSAEAVAFYGAIRKLNGLRVVGASCWAADALPVLQSLTHVTAVHGSWDMRAGGDVSKLVCPHVTELGETVDPPFQAFPDLVSVSFVALSHQSLQDLCRCCTALRNLALTKCTNQDVWDRARGFSESERVSVFRSIAQMPHLTHLEMSIPSDTELVGFTLAAAAVSAPKLRCLHLHGHLSAMSLVQLQSMHGLEKLTIHMSHNRNVMDTFHTEVVNLLLVGLAVLPKVCLVLPWQTPHGSVASVRQWAARLGLPLPAILHIFVAEVGPSTRLPPR